ncbi:MAG: enoyl-CoA hydratase/isomerase family protein [Acidimicrobiales bacterium]
MSTYETVKLETRGPVATLTLNRPEAANTLSRVLLRESVDAVDAVRRDESIRVLVVTGAGERHFCGGADLRDMAGAVNGTEKIEMPARMIFDVLELLPIPVIAAINGAAMGGGCEIALACDLRVMSESAKIGLPEIRFGALPGGGGTARLPRVVGFARAKEMIMLGRQLSAATAREYGLVTEVVPHDQVRVRANELAEELSALAPYAVRTAKYLLTENSNMDRHSALLLETLALAHMASADERQAAVASAMNSSGTYKQIFEAKS